MVIEQKLEQPFINIPKDGSLPVISKYLIKSRINPSLLHYLNKRKQKPSMNTDNSIHRRLSYMIDNSSNNNKYNFKDIQNENINSKNVIASDNNDEMKNIPLRREFGLDQKENRIRTVSSSFGMRSPACNNKPPFKFNTMLGQTMYSDNKFSDISSPIICQTKNQNYNFNLKNSFCIDSKHNQDKEILSSELTKEIQV